MKKTLEVYYDLNMSGIIINQRAISLVCPKYIIPLTVYQKRNTYYDYRKYILIRPILGQGINFEKREDELTGDLNFFGTYINWPTVGLWTRFIYKTGKPTGNVWRPKQLSLIGKPSILKHLSMLNWA